MSFGPNPWQQTNWDWRAAGNFIGGGAGAGLVVWTVAAGAHPALLVAGLLLIGAGLMCVWAEIGRPLRALHVFFNPQTSWMTREGMVALLLMPAGLASAVLWPALAPAAALLALAFVWCQGRILHAAKGIPAWREPRIVHFIVATGLAEGGSLLMLAAPGLVEARPAVFGTVAALIVLRIAAWAAYRSRIPARARAALAGTDQALRWAGTLAPLAAMALVAAGLLPPPLLAAAGLLAFTPGAWAKFAIVTRAGFNQGFALTRLPVRGVRR